MTRRLATPRPCSHARRCAAIERLVRRRRRSTLGEGLRQYEDGDTPGGGQILRPRSTGPERKRRATAHKHLAFIHCARGRERQCREEFRRRWRAARPQLDAAEAGHPVWGRSSFAVKRARRSSSALKQYEAGRIRRIGEEPAGRDRASAWPTRSAPTRTSTSPSSTARPTASGQCRDEFRRALAVDPALELAPAEAGHPVWGPIFRSVKGGR